MRSAVLPLGAVTVFHASSVKLTGSELLSLTAVPNSVAPVGRTKSGGSDTNTQRRGSDSLPRAHSG
jgi:hypothetical protein